MGNFNFAKFFKSRKSRKFSLAKISDNKVTSAYFDFFVKIFISVNRKILGKNVVLMKNIPLILVKKWRIADHSEGTDDGDIREVNLGNQEA